MGYSKALHKCLFLIVMIYFVFVYLFVCLLDFGLHLAFPRAYCRLFSQGLLLVGSGHSYRILGIEPRLVPVMEAPYHRTIPLTS